MENILGKEATILDALKKITENALAGKYKSNESLELNANNKEEDGEETNEE